MTQDRLAEEERHQAIAILATLGRWIATEPGRRIIVEHDEGGRYSARLERMFEREQTGGGSFVDALAQIATVASVEVIR